MPARRLFIVVITGGRSWTNPEPIANDLVRLIAKYDRGNILVVHGGAPGADMTADRVAQSMGVHTARVDALWDMYHRSAGPQRNRVMARLRPNLVLAYHWDLNDSKGTVGMVEIAQELGLRVVKRIVTRKQAMLEAQAWFDQQAAKKAARRKK